ncbi:hypothetical protein BDV26DRAFT_300009 [Aspergillus bertholletiae]|uniref:Uncharacterized protein n=1 Tax=Aspergillus bertholletiae TaxID=1226010 RepID=A0A5N7B123_9EURO|nr:hypothetical protein BDV26DRAFT_300009 [Aspergillus bertholletiae]
MDDTQDHISHDADNDKHLQIREYQVEMVNKSLEGNTIVVMPTGTGKTQIAVHRILAEIDKGIPDKLIWFLCPTIALCEQHLQTMTAHFPPMWCRSFTSHDNVDHWDSIETWSLALSNVKIAVSTYQVLYDALVHVFVDMARLSLIIFDEAHHCSENHPANKIMREYYHPQSESADQQRPAILGLTASPIFSDLSTVRHSYALLLRFTNQPLIVLRLPSCNSLISPTLPPILERLQEFLSSPCKPGTGLRKKGKELHRFVKQAERINRDLGAWAATNYIQVSIAQFKKAMRINAERTNTTNSERESAMEMLCELGILEEFGKLIGSEDVSPMGQCLLDALIEEHREGFRALIFVSERATVLALKWLIENHPSTRKLFCCGTFVGMSRIQYTKTKLGDVHDIRSQMETLQKFRDGLLDVIITTDALEEGIDIPACNTVINFNCTLNMKSFIQRRGRAREKCSKFIVTLEDEDDVKKVRLLQTMEIELVRELQDERRKVPPHGLEDGEWLMDSLTFHVPTTGARLTMGNAISHLSRFCSTLPAQPYVTSKPLFSCETNEHGQVQAMVKLPSNLDPSLHTFKSLRRWAKKKWAKEDAALEAYKALFHAGLVNGHLLPLQLSDILDKDLLPRSHYLVPEQLDPWLDVAVRWNLGGELFSHELHIIRPQKENIKLFLVLPVPLRMVIHIPLFSGPGAKFMAVVSSAESITTDIPTCQKVTHLILQSVHRGPGDQANVDYVNILIPDRDVIAISEFLERHSGTRSLEDCLQQGQALPSALGLLRRVTKPSRPLIVEPSEVKGYHGPYSDRESLNIKGRTQPLTRRRNFLHDDKIATTPPTEHHQIGVDSQHSLERLAAGEYVVDRLPSVYAEVALLAPSIFHQIGVYLIAEKLRTQIFSSRPVANFERMDLLCIAVNPTDIVHRSEFRTMAFIGDAIIKFLIVRQLFLHHTMWHEGLLTGVKDSIVSDAGLAAAVCQSRFGQYLITRQFNGKRWRPTFVSTVVSMGSTQTSQRHVGAATAADMAKALVGAAFLDNGENQAAVCVAAMVPKIKSWNTSSLHDGTYLKSRPRKIQGAAAVVDLEDLLGYTFSDRSLAIEAMTHPSCIGVYGTTSYRRLSFLGIGILEWVVVSYLHRQKRLISSKRLQSLKSAVTNNMFLAFICLLFYHETEYDTIESDDKGFPHTVRCNHRVTIHDFLRSQSDTLTAKLYDFKRSSSGNLHAIQEDLWQKGVYPWARLSVFRDVNVLSDIVQSLFGAIYTDSLASLPKCEALAERLGILPLLEHLISYDVTDKQWMTTKYSVIVDGLEVVMVKGKQKLYCISCAGGAEEVKPRNTS